MNMNIDNKGRYIRPIENPDFSLLCPIIQEAFMGPHLALNSEGYRPSGIYYTSDDFDRDLREGVVWYGAYHYEALIGCVGIQSCSSSRWRIQKLAVLPIWQGRGVGDLLMRTVEKEIFSWGGKKIELVCIQENAKLVDFYQAKGYRILRTKASKVPSGPMLHLAFMEKRMPHLIDQVGAQLQAYHLKPGCVLAPPKGSVEVCLMYHPDEVVKQSNTGHVLQRALPAHVTERIWHRKQVDQLLASLSDEFETVLLYPSDQAVPIAQYAVGRKPLRLLVVDGTWQQAQKMMSVSPQLKAIPHVKLSHLPPSEYRLRKNQKSYGICTLEAVAYSLMELGHRQTQDELMQVLRLWMGQGRIDPSA